MLPERLGPLGNTLPNDQVLPGGLAVWPKHSKDAPNPVIREFRAQSVTFSDPPDTVTVPGTKLKIDVTADEQRAWKRAYGEYLSDYANDFSDPEWVSLPGDQKKKFMEAAKEQASNYARQVLLGEMDKDPTSQEERMNKAARVAEAQAGR